MTPVLFSNSLVIFLVTLGLTGVVAPLAILLSKKIHLVDVPGSLPHHTHARTTPLSGGLILAVTFVIAATIFNLWKIPGVLTVFLASMIIFAFGIWDDLKGLNAPLKFLGQIAATTVLVVSGIRVQFLESPQIYLGGPLALYTALDVLITYLWVVGITNAFNLIVGVPIFDTFLVIYARLKTRKPVFNASLDHLYHRLTRVGFSTNRTVIVINGAAILLDCVAFIALTQTPVIANILFGLCLIAGAAGIILLGSDAAVKRGNQWMKKHIQGQETNDRI